MILNKYRFIILLLIVLILSCFIGTSNIIPLWLTNIHNNKEGLDNQHPNKKEEIVHMSGNAVINTNPFQIGNSLISENTKIN